jgi:DNA-binding CsgD family transcriptional regulator/pimeloyl-ACP methyl ester carboxylesterase
MLAKEDEQRGAGLTDDLIDHLYEVAVDPLRYEALLDRWEAMISPQRVAANSVAQPLGLKQFEGHFQRADQVLTRVLNDPTVTGAEAMLARIDRAAAFVVDRAMTVTGVNTAAASVLGVTRGARVTDIALGDGEAGYLAAQIARMFGANSGDTAVVRSRAARADRLIVLHLRLVRQDAEAPFVIAVTSELAWPKGFTEVLKGAFDLTPAEAEVVRALAEGQPLTQIAEARGRSVETIRAQLKAIMGKTETRSQSELVRLTLSTMEMAEFWGAAAESAPTTSVGFQTLEPRPFQSLTLPDGRRMDYLILGDPQGVPVLYWPLDYGLIRWPAQAEAEAARRGIKVISPVRAGYGQSTSIPKGSPYLVQLAEDHARLLDHLGAARVPMITLGGDSMKAIAFHAAYPERVSALLCAGGVLPITTPQQYERMDKWHRFILAGARYTPHLLPFMVKAGFALARRLGKRGFVHAVYGKSPADVATFEIPEVFEAMVCGSAVALSDSHSAHDGFSREVIAHETTDWTDEVASLRASGLPVHFFNGLQDPQVPPGTLADFRRDHPWIDYRVYPDAGQLLFFLKWRDVLGVLDRYVR